MAHRAPRYTLRAAAVAGALHAALLIGATPAAADDPLRVDAQVVDAAGGLGTDAQRVREAVGALRADEGTQLFVVYVDSFDGRDGNDWAAATARLSQLGTGDLLFAVAVRDRAYGYSAGAGTMPAAELDELMVRRVEPRLAANDWAGAAVTLAEGLGSPAASGGGGGGGVPVGLLIGAGAAAGGAAEPSLVASQEEAAAPGGDAAA